MIILLGILGYILLSIIFNIRNDVSEYVFFVLTVILCSIFCFMFLVTGCYKLMVPYYGRYPMFILTEIHENKIDTAKYVALYFSKGLFYYKIYMGLELIIMYITWDISYLLFFSSIIALIYTAHEHDEYYLSVHYKLCNVCSELHHCDTRNEVEQILEKQDIETKIKLIHCF